MVRVCDAIMGSGKTSATIGYINAHPPEVTLRYLGITDEEDKALYKNMCINVVSDQDFVG